MRENLEFLGLIVLCFGVLFLMGCSGNRILMVGNPPVEYTFLDYQTSCFYFIGFVCLEWLRVCFVYECYLYE